MQRLIRLSRRLVPLALVVSCIATVAADSEVFGVMQGRAWQEFLTIAQYASRGVPIDRLEDTCRHAIQSEISRGTRTALEACIDSATQLLDPKGWYRPASDARASLTPPASAIGPEFRMDADGLVLVRIPRFTFDILKHISAGLPKAFSKQSEKGINGVLIDLRGNSGGDVSGAVGVLSLVLAPGSDLFAEQSGSQSDTLPKLIKSKDYADLRTFIHAEVREPLRSLPLAVLLDHESAGASEAFAAAIRSNGRGLLVGERTHGSSIIRTLKPLPSGSYQHVLLIATGALLPAGKGQVQSWQDAGLLPDVLQAGATPEEVLEAAKKALLTSAR